MCIVYLVVNRSLGLLLWLPLVVSIHLHYVDYLAQTLDKVGDEQKTHTYCLGDVVDSATMIFYFQQNFIVSLSQILLSAFVKSNVTMKKNHQALLILIVLEMY